ncbi:MAG: NIPSNAP family protein [Deltaproteobacteria bacterium]|nr:NIPSNAP family protein [Deltaproteobacteria bacterium]MBW2053238.1 NIPSNAP family protein [Deltaproteobacteria bacterium]MBW2141797.1 NIPSNAP family protein [Deltaproteobacteria bacterium]MBW2324687.1 NIPSNAP family protein [Deltaproteobacteria bacterium]
MIYFEETLSLEPASPETLDSLVDFAQERLAPALDRLGARLVAAWYSDVELFCQVTQILEFDSLASFEDFRIKAGQDEEWTEIKMRLEELAPQQRTRLLEPLGPIPSETLHEAIKQSQESPLGAYSLAVLEVAPGRMPQFVAGLEQAGGMLPIVASWRPVTGKQHEVIDVWKEALRGDGYQPADDFSKQFFRGLRETAPRERLTPVYTLPYSPLR